MLRIHLEIIHSILKEIEEFCTCGRKRLVCRSTSELFVRIIIKCRLGTLSDRAVGTMACVRARVDVCDGADGDRRRVFEEDMNAKIYK